MKSVQTAQSRTQRLLKRLHLKARELAFETEFYSGLGQTWAERASIARLVAKLYAARLMPFDTLGWEADIVVRGVRYVVGVRTSEVYVLHEIYSVHQYERHPNFVPQPGWTVVDVGANIGVFTIQQGARGAKVYAFEPNPNCYRRLARNVNANFLADRVRLFPSALGDMHGTVKLFVEDGGTTGGFVVPAEAPGTDQAPTVAITTLDRMVDALQLPPIDLLKIDTEGSEVAVLTGAQQTLRKVRRIIVEFHSRDLLRRVSEILDRNGFSRLPVIDYVAQDTQTGQDEVGLLYAHKLN